jgi:hypothetical protein
VILSAKDLSPGQKTVIEGLLGRRVLQDEVISVRAVTPATVPGQPRHELADQLRNYFAEVDAHGRNASDAESELIVTEAIRGTRPSYRPQR